MLEKLKSRKFWFAVVGAMLPYIVSLMTPELDIETASQMSTAQIAAYIFGQGYVDAKKAGGA